MKNPVYVLVELIVFLLVQSFAQGQTFDLLIERNNEPKKGYDIDAVELKNEGFVITDCFFTPDYSYDCRLLKISEWGEIIDTFEFDFPGYYLEVFGFLQGDSVFYVYGSMRNKNTFLKKPFLGKILENFSIAWMNTYDTLFESCFFERSLVNSQGNIVMVGRTQDMNTFMCELDFQGSLLATTPLLDFPYLVSVVELPAIGAYHLLNYDDIRQFKVGSLEEELPIYRVSHDFMMFYPKQVTDSTYITSGVFIRDNPWTNQDSSNIGLKMFNHKMEEVYSIEYINNKNPDIPGYPTIDFKNSNSIFYGFTKNYSNSGQDKQLERWYGINNIKADGSINWQKFYGGNMRHLLIRVIATRDGGAMLLGTREPNNDYLTDIYIIKIDKNGNFVPKVGLGTNPTAASDYPISLYPNPIEGRLFVNSGMKEELKIELFDFQGRLLQTKTLFGSGTIEVEGLPAGMLFYRITGPSVFETGKLLKR